MSFILDALQRADAERARGTVPGLHARQVNSTIDLGRTGSHKGMGLAVVGVVTLALAATIGWMWLGNPPAAVVPVASVPIAQAPLTKPPTPAPPAATVTVTTLPAVAPPAAPAQPPKLTPVVPSTPPQRPPSAAKTPASPTKKVAVPAAPMAPFLSELPEDIRRQIPPLGISGAVYSDNPAQRLLLVNGQVLGQGSLAAPDVTLVEIRANHSEFSFRGTRFRIIH